MSYMDRYDALVKYEEHLTRLHRELIEGRGDAELADELRDVMAELWYRMPQEDQALVDRLSEGLYAGIESIPSDTRLIALQEPPRIGIGVINTRGLKKLELSNDG